jgi:hypothetical protein
MLGCKAIAEASFGIEEVESRDVTSTSSASVRVEVEHPACPGESDRRAVRSGLG